jgi:predicted Zn-dependent protease
MYIKHPISNMTIYQSTEWERKQGDMQYKVLLKNYKKDILPPSHRASITVKRVGSRITQAANTFIKENKPNESIGAPYTYTVIRSDQANAFVLPNNHIFVFTGLFQFVKGEDDLAAVLGHETAHNLARHAGERISGGILISMLARLTLLLDPSGLLYTLFLPTATLLHELPHSRDHEIEADYIGLHLAADACYDPKAAKRVFGAMKAVSDNDKASMPPEFISTHPSYDTRLTNFDDWLPDAMEMYNADGGYKCQRIRREMKAARQQAAILAQKREEEAASVYER